MAIPNRWGLSCASLLTYPLQWAAGKWLQSIPVAPGSLIPPSSTQPLIRRMIPKRSPPTMDLTYQSAIALQLASQWHQPVEQVTQQLHTLLIELSTQPPLIQSFHLWSVARGIPPTVINITMALLQNTTITPCANGHLQIQIPPSALALWLQWFLTSDALITGTLKSTPHAPDHESAPLLSSVPSTHSSPPVLPFQLLCTHARCCTILTRAQQQRHITLQTHGSQSNPQPQPSPTLTTSRVASTLKPQDAPFSPLWTISQPAPLPWVGMDEPVPYPTHPHPLAPTTIMPAPTTILCAYLSQIVHAVEGLERIDQKGPTSSLKPSLAQSLGTPPQKMIQYLVHLSQQCQNFEQQWTAQSWTAHPDHTHPLPSSTYLCYLGLVCITQRLLHLPFIIAGHPPLPYTL